MNLPQAPGGYDRDNESQTRQLIGGALERAFMKGEDVALQRGERLVLRDRTGGQLFAVTVEGGVLGLEACG